MQEKRAHGSHDYLTVMQRVTASNETVEKVLSREQLGPPARDFRAKNP